MRIARDIVGMVTIAFIFYILSSFVEERAVLARMVIPVAGVRIDQWLSNFRMLSSMGIAISFFASLIWYVLGQWVLRVVRLQQANRFWLWLSILILPFLACIISIAFTRQAQSNAWIAYLFYIVNNFGVYYLSTAFFSPASFKYIVPGSKKVRRWW